MSKTFIADADDFRLDLPFCDWYMSCMKSVLPLVFAMAAIFNCSGLDHDYLKIHKRALVADMHCDTVMRLMKGADLAVRDTVGHVDIPRLQDGGVDLQVFACWIPTETPRDSCVGRVDEMIDTLEAQISRNADKIEICKSSVAARKIIGSGRIAAFLGIENGVAIANSLDNLQHFYDRGIRYMTLTHTASNDWCISSADTTPAFDGLTDFGREVVEKMNELGMIVDVSHASVEAVDEVLKSTKDPIIASHSCVFNLCPHDRNLTDRQIKAIAANGGVIGVNFYNGYLSSRWNEVIDSITEANKSAMDSIEALYPNDYVKQRQAISPYFEKSLAEINIDVGTVVDHIDYIVRLVGADYVGLGSDFDGVHRLPAGLTDCSMVPNITQELVFRGYSNSDIQKILGGNFMRVFRQVCDNRAGPMLTQK